MDSIPLDILGMIIMRIGNDRDCVAFGMCCRRFRAVLRRFWLGAVERPLSDELSVYGMKDEYTGDTTGIALFHRHRIAFLWGIVWWGCGLGGCSYQMLVKGAFRIQNGMLLFTPKASCLMEVHSRPMRYCAKTALGSLFPMHLKECMQLPGDKSCQLGEFKGKVVEVDTNRQDVYEAVFCNLAVSIASPTRMFYKLVVRPLQLSINSIVPQDECWTPIYFRLLHAFESLLKPDRSIDYSTAHRGK